jgi:hypothetical protein
MGKIINEGGIVYSGLYVMFPFILPGVAIVNYLNK